MSSKSPSRKVILYIAMSLDGFIAGPNDELDFLHPMQQEGEDYGYGAFVADVDTVILGRRTYEKVQSMGVPFPHADKQTYVVSRQPLPSVGSTTFYMGDLETLLRDLRSRTGKHIFVDGGAWVVNELLQRHLIDELYISIVPLLLGDGIALFRGGRPTLPLTLVGTKQFSTGLVQLHYTKQSLQP
jgi:dihydrofolate reductase